MKHLIYIFALCVLIFSIIGNANAQVPNKISYQGLLTTSAGTPVQDGSYNLTFKIFDVSTGGSALWTEDQTGVAVQRGTFNVLLGSVTTIDISFNQTLYVEVTATSGLGIPSPITFSPRSELTSSPYAFIADTANFAKAVSGAWNLTGNAGTTEGTNFVGTTDAQAFDIRTNNVLRTRITTKGQIETYNTGQSVFVGEGAGASDDLSDNYNVFVGYQAGFSNTTGSANTANGLQALYSNTTGSQNTASGGGALLYNTTGAYNTASGTYALYSNTTGLSNTANGRSALYSNTTGYYNTASGTDALLFNTAGNNNTANGRSALRSNTTGSDNTANGLQALYSNTTGFNNTANGVSALYSNTTGLYNTANGLGALYYNTTGFNNTASGTYALYSNTTGYQNTANGYQALYFNTTGFNNTALGYYAFFSGAAYSNSTALGFNTAITASNQVRVGNSSVTSIGGQVGWTTLSDGRFKKDVSETMPDGRQAVQGLAFIMKLRPVTYHLDMDGIASFLKTPDPDKSGLLKESEVIKGKMLQTGFVGQEVEKAAQELGYDFSGIDKPKNENDYYGLRYAEFTVPLVKAVQEQQKMIEELRRQNEELLKRIEKLER
ncbi:MAG: tail fiber domain-containing protein [Bacteroidota bacterium]|nr:tail fiber domain-containing protein [Bacteroidota bacterium]